MKQWEDAAKHLDVARRLDPVQSPGVWLADAMATYSAGHYDRAEKSARGLEVGPGPQNAPGRVHARPYSCCEKRTIKARPRSSALTSSRSRSSPPAPFSRFPTHPQLLPAGLMEATSNSGGFVPVWASITNDEKIAEVAKHTLDRNIILRLDASGDAGLASGHKPA